MWEVSVWAGKSSFSFYVRWEGIHCVTETATWLSASFKAQKSGVRTVDIYQTKTLFTPHYCLTVSEVVNTMYNDMIHHSQWWLLELRANYFQANYAIIFSIKLFKRLLFHCKIVFFYLRAKLNVIIKRGLVRLWSGKIIYHSSKKFAKIRSAWSIFILACDEKPKQNRDDAETFSCHNQQLEQLIAGYCKKVHLIQ